MVENGNGRRDRKMETVREGRRETLDTPALRQAAPCRDSSVTTSQGC